MTKLVIVGGVAGGATAAARARRLDERARILVLERGEYVSFANCGLPYYIGGVIKKREDLLLSSPQIFKERYNIEVRTQAEVTALDRAAKAVEVKDLRTGAVYREAYDKLILSPGAEPVKPPLPGIDLEGIYTLRSLPDSDRLKARLDADPVQSAVVVGGGFIGLEMAENLARRGVQVSIVEMLDQVLAPLDFEMAALVHRQLRRQEIRLVLADGLKSFDRRDGRLVATTRQGREIACDLALLAIGIRPESGLARAAGLKITERGHIWVDQTLRTSDPDIYAVGDAVRTLDFVTGLPTVTALAGPANKQARIAADNALGRRSLYRGSLGTMAVKVFGLTVAASGPNEKTLTRAGLPYLVSYTHSDSQAGYYPGGQEMAVKLLFSPGGGRVLGAQIVGGPGVDKRIDVLAAAIRAGLTVFDLEELDLAYAPPYSSAKDPVNIAGYVAANLLRGDLENVYPTDLEKLDPDRDVVLDVRSKVELRLFGRIEDSVNIPLPQLRERLPELDRSKRYIIYCAVGYRAYLAYRILVQNGFEARNLSGGFATYGPAFD
ncbi:MAG: FAD-dependent oxidoreductase [Thermodesulfobacteriota bacterium]